MMQKHEDDRYAIFEAGPFHRVLEWLRLENRHGLLAVICILGTWVPLLCLTLYEGTFMGGTSLSFLEDIPLHSRLLVAMPLLVLIRPVINLKIAEVIRYVTTEMLSAEDEARMREKTFPVFRKLASSFWTDLAILILVFISTIGVLRGGFFNGMERGISSWMISGISEQKEMSYAGIWAIAVSMPMFQFLLIRWLWRYLVWIVLLFKFATSPLRLLPSHADRSGGLGILVLAQRSFNLVFLACGCVIAGQLAMKIINDPSAFDSLKGIAIGFIFFSLMLILLPLFFFTARLIKTKQRGLLHFSYLASAMSMRFEKDWLNNQSIESRVEGKIVDPSMAYDYASMFDNLQQMRAAPVTLMDIGGMAVGLFIPFIPILFIHFSAIELLQKVVQLLL